MTWEKFEDEYYTDCIHLKEVGIFLAKKPVIFGHRLVGGDIRYVKMSSHLDLCCRNDFRAYTWLKSAVVLIVSHNFHTDPSKDLFRGIPEQSKIKPYPNDDEFLATIHTLLNECVQYFSPDSCLMPYEL